MSTVGSFVSVLKEAFSVEGTPTDFTNHGYVCYSNSSKNVFQLVKRNEALPSGVNRLTFYDLIEHIETAYAKQEITMMEDQKHASVNLPVILRWLSAERIKNVYSLPILGSVRCFLSRLGNFIVNLFKCSCFYFSTSADRAELLADKMSKDSDLARNQIAEEVTAKKEKEAKSVPQPLPASSVSQRNLKENALLPAPSPAHPEAAVNTEVVPVDREAVATAVTAVATNALNSEETTQSEEKAKQQHTDAGLAAPVAPPREPADDSSPKEASALPSVHSSLRSNLSTKKQVLLIKDKMAAFFKRCEKLTSNDRLVLSQFNFDDRLTLDAINGFLTSFWNALTEFKNNGKECFESSDYFYKIMITPAAANTVTVEFNREIPHAWKIILLDSIRQHLNPSLVEHRGNGIYFKL